MNKTREILIKNAQWRKLTNLALRARPSSPRQKAIIAEYQALERQLLGVDGPSTADTDWRMVAIGLGAYRGMPEAESKRIQEKLLQLNATPQQIIEALGRV